ncbi:MAG: FAD-dependent oxidoreductase [Planctomycetaceae bacterium]|nr:FAD-dependent oxidoreductase [Planctomycetaceae bacterium]MCB9953213.1 FAD-dependent oxidoreductase [Planctomycetaceae bacterium]
MSRLIVPLGLLSVLLTSTAILGEEISTDLLIVGGTESGCAAAASAARAGVKSIVLVNDIDWLGGQFSAEGLVAIDENRGPDGYGHGVPFPRSGLFREVIDRIEALNLEKYGKARPGNTRVITTCRPSDAEQVFRELLQSYVKSGQLKIISGMQPAVAIVEDERLRGMTFQSTGDTKLAPLTVKAKLTIDATDWGDVIKLSGAAYEFGPDLKSKYGEPLAPESREEYPVTDMNPITYCMVINETDTYEPIPAPPGYDARDYRSHSYPKDPLWLYESRRVIDHYNFKEVTHPDVLLLCFPAFDFPLDTWPQHINAALEATEQGASTRNIAELTPTQRQIVFDESKRYSLGFLHYLQTEVHDAMPDKTHSFRRFRLSDEFGTPDQLPPKPYVRESLRLKSMYMYKQQDTMGAGGRSTNFANVMPHDGLFAWQFEFDFHPTRRDFFTDEGNKGPWMASFRSLRTWGPPYSGRALFPIRSLVPESLDGLLGAQKNLGYTSIVSSAVRLHDQSMAVGQGAGAVAAVSILNDCNPRDIPWSRSHLAQVWNALATTENGQMPQTLWPFGDLDPTHPAFVAVQQLAVRQILPMQPYEVDFRPNDPATFEWQAEILRRSFLCKDVAPGITDPQNDVTRAEFAMYWWKRIARQPELEFDNSHPGDRDADGIPDIEDPLPYSAASSTWPEFKLPEDQDGIPEDVEGKVQHINFAGANVRKVDGFLHDAGQPFDAQRGFGWSRDISANSRKRDRLDEIPRDTFLFTRSDDIWTMNLPNGTYHVTVCVGDSGHEQFGQNVTVNGSPLMRDVRTETGWFLEKSMEVEVTDGKLTIEIGMIDSNTNTCINWVQVQPVNH